MSAHYYSIVTYQSDKYCLQLVNTLLAQLGDDPYSRIFVTVNDEAAAPEILGLTRSERLVVIRGQGNVGFGAAHARIHSRAPEDTWVWCMNPDLMLPNNWVERAQTILNRVPEAVLVVGAPVTGGRQFPFPRPEGYEALRFAIGTVGIRLPGRKNPEPYGVPGALFAIRKTPRLPVVFDSRSFLFFEEMILAELVRRAGGSVHFAALPPAEHQVGGSRNGVHLVDYFVQSQDLYLRSYLGWPSALVFLLNITTRMRLTLSRGV